ncbi:hypothetical protein IB276_11705 [Ensifer sp. ENS04]|uniref:hypothetical protein n=1 Tax=Ensifer sp. ENS04 TaxID=2769281 RepID=UPI00177E9F1A|nr:hypothetical protein [Ensifer sp. ENS04]MBD9540119.1 hypothetical protein [Ensifer sp. ENS04]
MARDGSNREMIEMMRRCSSEIKDLRRQIADLQPKAEAYEYLTAVLRLVPDQRRNTMSEDLAWLLDKRIREIEDAEAAAKCGPENPGKA